MLEHDCGERDCDSGKPSASTTVFKKYAPAGGGGRSIRRREGKTANPDIDRWEDRPKQTYSNRRPVSSDTAPVTFRTVPTIPLRPARNSIASATLGHAGRRHGEPAHRSDRAMAATSRRRADRCG